MESSLDTNKQSEDDQGRDSIKLLIDLYQIIRKRFKIIILSSAISVIGLVIYSLVVEEVFTAKVLLTHVQDDESNLSSVTSQFGALSSFAGFNIGNQSSQRNVNIATLTSRNFIEDFIKEEEIASILLEDSDFNANSAPDWHLYKSLRQNIFIKEDLETGLVTLSVNWKDPNIAAEWANSIVSSINNRIRLQDIQESQQNISFIEKEIENTKLSEVKVLLYEIMQKQTEKMMLANVRKEYAFKVINPAYPPELRSYPKRKLLVSIGSLISVLLILFVVFGVEFFNLVKKRLQN